jgi:hypothetical protein
MKPTQWCAQNFEKSNNTPSKSSNSNCGSVSEENKNGDLGSKHDVEYDSDDYYDDHDDHEDD